MYKRSWGFIFTFSVTILLFVIGILTSSVNNVVAEDPKTCDDYGDGPIAVNGKGEACLSGEKNTNYECPTGIGNVIKPIGTVVYMFGIPVTVASDIESAANTRCEEDLQGALAVAYLTCQASCAEAAQATPPLSCTANPTVSGMTPCTARCHTTRGLSISVFGASVGINGYDCTSTGSAILQCDCSGYGAGTPIEEENILIQASGSA